MPPAPLLAPPPPSREKPVQPFILPEAPNLWQFQPPSVKVNVLVLEAAVRVIRNGCEPEYASQLSEWEGVVVL